MVELKGVNAVSAFPVSGPDLLAWAQDIERLAPGVPADAVRAVMDAFKLGRLTWDKTMGIQNIFFGLKRLQWSGTAWELINWPLS